MSITPDINRAALILIDLQRDLLHQDGASARRGLGSMGPGELIALVEGCQRAATAMRRAGRPIVFANTAFRHDYRDAAVAPSWLNPRVEGGGAPFLVEGSWGAELIDGLGASPDDYFIGKKGHAAFLGTHLDRLLTNLGVEHCIIGGGGVSDSIGETVRVGGALGYELFLVEDALYPPSSPDIGLLKQHAEITSVEAVCAWAEGAAPAPDQERPDYALIVVDMQNDFLRPDRPAVRYGYSAPTPEDKRERLIANTQTVAGAMRARGWPVIFVKVARRPDNLDDGHGRTFRRRRVLGPADSHVQLGSWGAEIVAELRPHDGDFVIEKKGASGFGFTPLHRVLRNLRVRRCLVTGGATSGCVRATVFDGLALGYEMTVIADATYPPNSPHLEALSQWCDVRATESVLAGLRSATVGVASPR